MAKRIILKRMHREKRTGYSGLGGIVRIFFIEREEEE
jgi:hypothetical protein